MDIQNGDYILDKKNRFWIIHGYGKEIYGNLVFRPKKTGDRYNKILNLNYIKVIDKFQHLLRISKKGVKKIFKPKECFRKNYKKLSGIWKKIADSFLNIGIKKRDIGIFGSYLIGFSLKKDIDFIIYGINNCIKVKKNMAYIRKFIGVKKISKRHIIHQKKKYSLFLSKKNDFQKMLKNKWPSLQIDKFTLTTIRFSYKKREIPRNIEVKRGRRILASGIVRNSFGTNFMPRIFFLENKNKRIRVLTYFWAYQSCLKDGQKIKICGEYNQKFDTIFISSKKHWIKIL